MSSPVVLSEKEGSNCIITINRDEKRNAISGEVYNGIKDAVFGVAIDPAVRAIIIRGAGKGFSAGIDFNFLAGMGIIGGAQDYVRMKIREGQEIMNLIEDVEKPVIFALHGYCFGAALEVVLAGDFRVAQTGTKIGIQETALGFIPDMGGIARLTALVGPSFAKELIMTAGTIDADRALEIGLVNRVVDDATEGALAMAREITKNGPLAVGLVKKLVRCGRHLDTRTFLELEAIGQTLVCNTDDAKEGVMAKLQKREAKFEGK
jgi:enoyl-CoA hydratase